ncbi:hypothetical protein QJS04_geneDACA024504 [Acorus gramineus]|uniref:Uncharacterized protein n=1 Tax=Acorus gramineus TaxID=55184 RepID=A0AAV8ZXU2_ACOGR|nr:hypothetical protein QJS04_geneDACA024504 [Acorus gramineus]
MQPPVQALQNQYICIVFRWMVEDGGILVIFGDVGKQINRERERMRGPGELREIEKLNESERDKEHTNRRSSPLRRRAPPEILKGCVRVYEKGFRKRLTRV